MKRKSDDDGAKIKGMADLARFLAPDDPMSVVDPLMQLYHGGMSQAGPIATQYPHVYRAYIIWDRLDDYPTAAQLRAAIEPSQHTYARGNLHAHGHAMSIVVPGSMVHGDGAIRWIRCDGPGASPIGLSWCGDIIDSCPGIVVYTLTQEHPQLWSVQHLGVDSIQELTSYLERPIPPMPRTDDDDDDEVTDHD